MIDPTFPQRPADVPYTKGLHRITESTWAYLLPDGSWGWSNAGVVAGDGQALLFDTLFDLALTGSMLDDIAVALPDKPIRTAALSHANGDHCFGTELLNDDVAIYAAPETAKGMLAVSPDHVVDLFNADLGPAGTPFFRHCFGSFRFDNITLRLPDKTVDGPTRLDIGGIAVDLLPLGPAHTDGDMVAWIPAERVLFTGDLLFVGGTPVMWAGPVRNWIDACNTMLALDPEFVIPGHGPVSDQNTIIKLRDYWIYLSAQARDLHSRGVDYIEAARVVDLAEYGAWVDPERTVPSMHTLYREIDPETPPVDILRSFVSMAEWRIARGQQFEAKTHGC